MQEKSILKNCMIVESKRFCCSKKDWSVMKSLRLSEWAPILSANGLRLGKKEARPHWRSATKGDRGGFTENCFRMKNGKFVVQSRIVVQISWNCHLHSGLDKRYKLWSSRNILWIWACRRLAITWICGVFPRKSRFGGRMSATISEFASGWKKSIRLLLLAPDRKKRKFTGEMKLDCAATM